MEKTTSIFRLWLSRRLQARAPDREGDVVTRLDALQIECAKREQSLSERIDALHVRFDILFEQNQRFAATASERDETIQNLLADLSQRTGIAMNINRRDGAAQALGEVRAEVSALRADLVSEIEARNRAV